MNIIVNRTGVLTLLTAIAGALEIRAQTILSEGHSDVGLAYEGGLWNLHVHSHVPDAEYAPNEAILRLNPNAARPIPSAPSYGFLGQAGSTFYVLPQVEEPGLLFLGLAAEEVVPGDFNGDTLRMTLKTVSGPGNFSLYLVDGFGNPTVRMNSGDGIADAADFVDVPAGSHNDYNWAFTAPGTYTVGFEASGIHNIDGQTASGIVNYTFDVVPEPQIWALATAGSILLFGIGLRQRKR